MLERLEMTSGYTQSEMMAIAGARALRNGQVCFVGIGAPSTAANLARRLHAPDLVLIYESGCIGSKPSRLPLSIGDGELAETADAVVSVPEIFNYWLQPGRIDVGFLGAAQIDRFANLNTTVIGAYGNPKVRLPGAGGAPEIGGACKEVIIMISQSKNTFVDPLDFRTTVGFGDGVGSRETHGLVGGGPTVVITDKAILRPDPQTLELTLVALHSGVSVEDVQEHCGWDLKVAQELEPTLPPTEEELHTLRELLAASKAG